MNFHILHQKEVTIYIMEGTTVYLNSPTYIMNVTNLHIKSYSKTKSLVEKARIVSVFSPVIPDLQLSPTKYHLLEIPVLVLPDQVLDSTNFELEEWDDFTTNNAIIKLFNSGLTLENILITFENGDSATTHSFINPFHMGEKELLMTNIDFHFQGSILYSRTSSLSLTMKNSKVDIRNLNQILNIETT